jgi:hypothetical protein
MSALSSTNLRSLILLRLAASPASPPRRSDVERSLYSLAGSGVQSSAWRELFSAALTELEREGHVTAKPLSLSETGAVRVRELLGLKMAPKARNWADFKRKYLRPLVLGQRATDGRVLEPLAAILGQALNVEAPSAASVQALVDLWLAEKLGLTSTPLTLSALRVELLARELGVPLGQKRDLARVARIAAAMWASSAKSDADSLTNALTARWLRDEYRARPAPNGSVPGPAAPGEGAPDFADKVAHAVKSPHVRRFGADKVFIASVWEELKHDPALSALGEQGFKRALVEAHRDGKVTLARADLVAAMDPDDVAASEVRHLNASFHFIQANGGSP